MAPIYDELVEHNIPWARIGELLMYERILAGDRSEMANPRGLRPEDIPELVEAIKSELGVRRFGVLTEQAERMRQWVKKWGLEAHREGLFTDDLFDIVNGNERYMPFQVVEYMEENVTWKVKPQTGTLKDINNPANAGILKTISTIRAIEKNRLKRDVFSFLKESFPEDAKPAKTVFTGKGQVPIPPREAGVELATYYEKGKLRGFYTDPLIVHSLENDSIARNRAVMALFSPVGFLNRAWFKKAFVVYNPGWIPFNLFRDFWRFWRNTPGMTIVKALRRYREAVPAARVRGFGISKEENDAALRAGENVLDEMERERIFSFTFNDYMAGAEEEDSQIEAILTKAGLVKEKPMGPLVRFIWPLLKKIREIGDMVETLPKVAGYYELHGKMAPGELRTFIRRNIGSPDFWEKGYLTPVINELFLFSNPMIQGTASDIAVGIDPKTRAGFWWKQAKLSAIPKVIMFAALMGLFGKGLKDCMEDASEYDRTNYIILCLGRDDKSEKSTYIRIPMDESSRLISGILWKIMRGSQNEPGFFEDITQVASLTAGQLPSVTPILDVLSSSLQFATGRNPYDAFRGRLVIPEEEYRAGGTAALGSYLTWVWEQLGGSIFHKFYTERVPREKTAGERILQLPIVSNVIGRFVKISDYGRKEKFREIGQAVEQEAAQRRLAERDIINEYVTKARDAKGIRIPQLERELVKEILGHEPKTAEEVERRGRIVKKFRLTRTRGSTSPEINALIDASSNEQRLDLLREFKETMSTEEFKAMQDLNLNERFIAPLLFSQIQREK